MPEKLSEDQKIMLKEMRTRAKYEKNQVKKTPEGIEMTGKKGPNLPEARCPKCGKCYHSVLLNPEHQICPKCGTKLEINQEKGKKKQSVDLGRLSNQNEGIKSEKATTS